MVIVQETDAKENPVLLTTNLMQTNTSPGP